MRTLATILLALLTTIPGAALASAERAPAPDAAATLHAALADQASLLGVAAKFPKGAGLGAQLATVTGAPAQQVPAATFDEAMATLYAEAGLVLPANYAKPDAAMQVALAPVISALAESARLTNDAFRGLTPDERAFVLDNIAITVAPDSSSAGDITAARVQALAQKVDTAEIRVGAATLAAALDRFVAPAGSTASWVSPNGLIEIGSTGNDSYCTERLLIIDLGGNDWYACHPGAYAPGSSLPLPVSAVLDLGGNDVYMTNALHSSSLTSTWGAGVGIGGVGMIIDRWGDDNYITNLYDAATYCSFDFYTGAPQYVYAQGVGALGVGAILDDSGNDAYQVANINDMSVTCHFGWVYTFAQGTGLLGGVGLLIDDTGDDSYFAYSEAIGKFDNIAGVYSQAAAAGGIGVLVDKEGSDHYYAQADGFITPGYVKGAFGYDFSQASVTATRKQPLTTFGTTSINKLGNVQPGASPLLCPTSVDPTRGIASAGLGSGACDNAGVAVLIDIMGGDTFDAITNADDRGSGCSNGIWSVASSQGSAAWTGVAALINVDVDGRDSFNLAPSASGSGCGYPVVRAHAYGQGFGGPILWNFWDMPLPQGVEQHPIGILASLGVPEERCIGDQQLPGTFGPIVNTLEPQTPVGTDPCRIADSDLPALTSTPDSYHATAMAKNPYTAANAEVWAQGASDRTVVIPSYWTGTYPALGVGLNLDVGGDDDYHADAFATSPTPDTLVTGQAGTVDAVAGLTNVGGSDSYNASAIENGVSQPAKTHVQGYADSTSPSSITVGPICITNSLVSLCINPVTLPTGVGNGLAVFVDVFGNDSYSEAAERFGCQQNGSLLGTWPVTAPLGTAWWGTVVGNPCAAPTPDVGSGTVIGLDWWSEASP